jgi:SAM-dependent methyltransferase
MNPGTKMLFQMARARRFNRWMAETIAPFLQGDVLEIGAGIGNLTEFLCCRTGRYVALDTEPEHLLALARHLSDRTNLETIYCDAADARDFAPFLGRFDTIVALNVLEHIRNDVAALSNIFSALRPRGRSIVLVPQCPFAFGSLDEVLEHQRRYSRSELAAKMISAGFRLERMLEFNRATLPGWILNSRILRRKTLSTIQLGIFNALVPLARRIDPLLPWPATSLIAIGVRES